MKFEKLLFYIYLKNKIFNTNKIYINSIDNNDFDNRYVIRWDVGRKCNLDCKYCYQFNDLNKEKYKINLDKFINFFNSLDKPVIIDIVGGEPSVCIDIEKFLYNSDSKKITLRMFTNIYKPYSYWKKISKYDNVFVVASLHYVDFKNKNEYIKKLKLFENRSVSTFMVIKNSYDIFLEVFNEIKDFAKINLMKIFPDSLTNYNELKQLYEKIFDYLYLNMSVNFNNNNKNIDVNSCALQNLELMEYKNFKCEAGRNYFNIDWRGNIYKCKSHFFSKNPIPIGNILEGLPKINNLTCNFNKCLCGIFVPKWK